MEKISHKWLKKLSEEYEMPEGMNVFYYQSSTQYYYGTFVFELFGSKGAGFTQDVAVNVKELQKHKTFKSTYEYVISLLDKTPKVLSERVKAYEESIKQ